ncbi:DNA polymerase III subunit delta [candidate division KSB1 bacterium]|nr:DNA polymerase III subunit delta [candidate division KSB1 bacterium]
MEYNTFLKNLKKKEIAPVYYFFGEEKFAMDQATDKLIEHSVQPEVRDFNLDIYYASDTDSSKILDTVRSYPMMAERRTVIVREIQKWSATHLNKIADYAESPTPTTCLLLLATAGNLRGKAYASLKKNTAAIEFKPLYDNQVGTWIKNYVEQHSKEITPKAIQLLHAYVGNLQMNLVNELEKVFLNLGESKRIDEANVEAVVGLSKEFNVFNLTKVIGQKQLKAGLLIINQLLEQGEPPTVMIIRITNYFMTLLKVVAPQNIRKSDKELASIAGVNFYFVKEYRAAARFYTSRKIEQAFSLLQQADRNLKTGYQTPEFIMQLLVYNLIKL